MMTETLIVVGTVVTTIVVAAVGYGRLHESRNRRRGFFCATPVQDEETLKALQAKRRQAVEAAGESWLLHPKNEVKRKPRSRKPWEVRHD
jgi:hypothetical protein